MSGNTTERDENDLAATLVHLSYAAALSNIATSSYLLRDIVELVREGDYGAARKEGDRLAELFTNVAFTTRDLADGLEDMAKEGKKEGN